MLYTYTNQCRDMGMCCVVEDPGSGRQGLGAVTCDRITTAGAGEGMLAAADITRTSK